MTNLQNTKHTPEVWVLSCEKYAGLLPEFHERLGKFWGVEIKEYVSQEPMEKWSNGLFDMMKQVRGEYFILLHEDFYIIDHVDKAILYEVWNFICHNNVSRFALTGNHNPERTFPHGHYYVQKQNAPYLMSFEASIFSKTFVKKYLKENEDAWAAEREGSKRALGQGEIVMYTEMPIIHYKDAMRRGEKQII